MGQQILANKVAELLPNWQDLPKRKIVKVLARRLNDGELNEMREDLSTWKREAEDQRGRSVHTDWHRALSHIRAACFHPRPRAAPQ